MNLKSKRQEVYNSENKMVDKNYDMDVEGEYKSLSSSSSRPLQPSSNFESASYYFRAEDDAGELTETKASGTKSCFRQPEKKRACRCGGSSNQPDGVLSGDLAVPLTTTRSQEETSTSEVNKMGLESLGSELICAICQQLFVEASTIECGHSFCRMCIENWLKAKLSCPICRKPVNKPPIGSVCLDKAVRVIVEMGDQERELIQELMERKKQATKTRESECFAQSCLETLSQKAQQQGVKFVHISKPWSSKEQSRFLCGIERHQGVAREAFCKVVELTYEWVGKATKDELLVAAANVKLKDMDHQPRSTSDWKASCILSLRARLEMYIRYG